MILYEEGNMNKRSLVKFRYGNQIGLFHYVLFEGNIVVLSEDNTRKIKHIEKNNNLEITFDIEKNDYDVLDVTLVREKKYIKQVYNYMIEANNPYFQDGDDHLVAIIINKK